MKNNFSEQGNLLLKHIDTADAICVGAAAGMSVAAGYDCAYHNDKYFEKYLGEFGRKYGFEGSFNDIITAIRPVKNGGLFWLRLFI